MKIMPTKKIINKLPYVILCLIVITYFYTMITSYKIDNYGEIVIAKIVKYKIYPKQETSTFIFYTKKKTINCYMRCR